MVSTSDVMVNLLHAWFNGKQSSSRAQLAGSVLLDVGNGLREYVGQIGCAHDGSRGSVCRDGSLGREEQVLVSRLGFLLNAYCVQSWLVPCACIASFTDVWQAAF